MFYCYIVYCIGIIIYIYIYSYIEVFCFFYLSSSLNVLLCLIGFFYFVFYIMNINIYNLFYICTLACIWALFLRINLFVFVYTIKCYFSIQHAIFVLVDVLYLLLLLFYLQHGIGPIVFLLIYVYL